MDEAGRADAVRVAVEAVAAGPVEEAVATTTSWRFPHPDGSVTQAPVWIVRTPGQLWLAAVTSDDAYLSATGDPEAAAVSSSWAGAQLRLGGRSFALSRKTVPASEAMIAAFKADPGGPDYPPTPEPIATSPVADGAVGLPDGWSEAVPGDPEDRWLFGVSLVSEWTFNAEAGPRTAPLVIGVRGRGVAVAASFEGQRFAAAIDGPVTASPGSFGRTQLAAGPFRLEGGRLDGARMEKLVRLANAGEAERWAIIAADAMDDGRPLDAVALWTEALVRGHREAVILHLAIAALAVDRFAHAVTLLREAGDELESGWMAPLPTWRRTAGKATDAVVERIEATVTAAEAPGPGWPWPPSSPAEAWAAAGGPVTLPEPPGDPRRLQIQAAVAEQREPGPVAAAAYRVAARAWAGAGDPKAAVETLASALRLEPDSPDHFQAAVWAEASGAEDAFEGHVKAGLNVSPSAESLLALDPSAQVMRKASEVAKATGLSKTAARLLIRAMEAEAPDHEAKLALARRVADELQAPDEAARLIEAVADARQNELADGLEALWIEAADLHLRAGASERALGALSRAVQAGFLSPDIYRTAAGKAGSADVAGWWQHVAWVLNGQTPSGRPRPRVEGLSKARLDGLHPGGEGWLEDIKRWIQAPNAPERDHLIRGLERIESSTYPDIFRAVGDVCQRLETQPPVMYVYRGDDGFGLSGWPVQPPLLLVGHQHLAEGPRRLSGDALTFAVAVELVHLACGHPILSFDSSLVGTSRSAYQAFGRFAGTAETVVDVITLLPIAGQTKALLDLTKKLLTRWNRVNKATGLASPVMRWLGMSPATGTEEATGVGPDRLEGTALQLRMQADRAALLLCGSLRGAVEAILKTSRKGLSNLDTFEREGVGPLLDPSSDGLAPDDIVRLSALIAWSSGLGLTNDVDEDGRAV